MKKWLLIPIVIIIFTLIYINTQDQIENAVFAIVKLSYNIPGQTPVQGGICGTAFLINDHTLLTAHHVLNTNVTPSEGFKYCQFWLLSRGNKTIIPIEPKNCCKDCPEIETTFIKLKIPLINIKPIKVENSFFKINDPIYCIGHSFKSMPITDRDVKWDNNILIIKNYSLKNCKSDKNGYIKTIEIRNANYNDVKLKNKKVIQPSFKAILGMSGGPLLHKNSNKLIGLMSYGFPPDSDIKDIVYAITVNEIASKIQHIDN